MWIEFINFEKRFTKLKKVHWFHKIASNLKKVHQIRKKKLIDFEECHWIWKKVKAIWKKIIIFLKVHKSEKSSSILKRCSRIWKKLSRPQRIMETFPGPRVIPYHAIMNCVRCLSFLLFAPLDCANSQLLGWSSHRKYQVTSVFPSVATVYNT